MEVLLKDRRFSVLPKKEQEYSALKGQYVKDTAVGPISSNWLTSPHHMPSTLSSSDFGIVQGTQGSSPSVTWPSSRVSAKRETMNKQKLANMGAQHK